MKRHIAPVLAILTVTVGVGWNIANHPERSAGLSAISLDQGSEHTYAGQNDSLARVRVRVSPSDMGPETGATAGAVPQIALATE
jgi:hypothetical protein